MHHASSFRSLTHWFPPDTDSDYGGWPEDEGEYPVDHVTEEHREVMAEMCSKAQKPNMPVVPCVPPPPEAAGLHVAAGGDPDDSTEEVEVAREAEEDIGEPLQEEPDFGGGGDDFSLDEENDVVVEEEGEREDSATPADESEMLESDENARPNISAPLSNLEVPRTPVVSVKGMKDRRPKKRAKDKPDYQLRFRSSPYKPNEELVEIQPKRTWMRMIRCQLNWHLDTWRRRVRRKTG